jgi:hypothetical protein
LERRKRTATLKKVKIRNKTECTGLLENTTDKLERTVIEEKI